MIKFSKCCTPVPGDDIVGFITKGFGVSVHRADCPNVRDDDPEQKGRWVNVCWADDVEGNYPTTLVVEAADRNGLLLDVANVITAAKLKMTEINGRDIGGNKAILHLTFEVKDLSVLNQVRQKIRNISGVIAVRRGTN